MPAFVSGTRKFFKNATAPTGWTQDATAYNHALRIVTTTAFGSGGGSLNFTDMFSATRSGGSITYPGVASTVTLGNTTMDIPAHTHTYVGYTGTPVNSPNGGYYYPAGPTSPPTITAWYNSYGPKTSGSAGVSGGHTHSLSSTVAVSFASTASTDFSVKYVDSIICIKD